MLATLKRRSLSLDDIVRTTGVSPAEARAGLDRLIEEGKIRLVRFNDEWFYAAGGGRRPVVSRKAVSRTPIPGRSRLKQQVDSY